MRIFKKSKKLRNYLQNLPMEIQECILMIIAQNNIICIRSLNHHFYILSRPCWKEHLCYYPYKVRLANILRDKFNGSSGFFRFRVDADSDLNGIRWKTEENWYLERHHKMNYRRIYINLPVNTEDNICLDEVDPDSFANSIDKYGGIPRFYRPYEYQPRSGFEEYIGVSIIHKGRVRHAFYIFDTDEEMTTLEKWINNIRDEYHISRIRRWIPNYYMVSIDAIKGFKDVLNVEYMWHIYD
eukprot:TRINITY_DN2623_c0_g1_i1.p1 TRINITY_DN2623_c0_g1~~TRINITY_DN2623_c0_g1_i1.p1  ORF type:complete len:240 (-),score=26.83 TRINITY_DN2623_c0_g1_i1:38-757(-)